MENISKEKYKSIPKIYKDVGDFEFYEVNGVNHLRTTAILSHWVPPRLKTYLQKNSLNASEKKLKSAGDVGSAIHKQIEMSIDPTHLNPQEMKLYENGKLAYLKFKEEIDCQPLAYELTLASPTLGIAGTVDMICMYEGKLTLVDWKSGFVGESARWQTSAYKYLFEENYGEEIRVVVVKLDKTNGTYFPVKYVNYDMSLRAYIGVLSAYQDTHYKQLMEAWPQFWNKDFSGIKHKDFSIQSQVDKALKVKEVMDKFDWVIQNLKG